jgi:Rrf2 family transcriptional regulator, cysteine metabolism repressor
MRVSARAEYGCLAVLDLAMNYGSNEPVPIKRICESHNIPHGFLVQILQQLKGAGYVISTRGAAGGYQLAQSPDQISLGDALNAIDGPRHVDYDLASSDITPALRALRSVWQQAAEQVDRMLVNVTFADLVECARRESSMPVVGDWI